MKKALKFAATICTAMLISLVSGCRETTLRTGISVPKIAQSTSTSPEISEPEISEPPTAPAADIPAAEPIEETDEKCSETAEYIINYMQVKTGCTGEDFGYIGEWCACILSDLLIANGYDIYRAENPCDLAVTLLNNDYADFFCFRQGNYDSLVEWGLQNTERVKMMSREDYVPTRGDMVCYLFPKEAEKYNWSHIGIISEDYNGEYISSLEGNIDVDFALEDPHLRYISTIRRPYNDSVVGIIRLK